MNKLKIFIIVFGFLMCFGGKLQAVSVSDFVGLKDAIDDNNYDINLQDNVIYVWSSSPTIAQSGKLHGTSGALFAILDGDNKYQAFKFNPDSDSVLDGNFLFNKFVNKRSSGTIYANASSISFVNGTIHFSTNINTTGGALYSVNSKILFSTITINFTSNTSASEGSAIFAESSNIDFINAWALFLENEGSAVFADGSNIEFINSRAVFLENEGSAILAYDSNLNFKNTNVSFTSNSAFEGGALHLTDTSRISFESNVDFVSNRASEKGGAIFSKIAIVNFSRSAVNFTSNSAYAGGAVYSETLTETDFDDMTVRFAKNTALSSGGAVFIIDPFAGLPEYASVIKFTNASVLFYENNALNGGGGALYAGNNSDIDFRNSPVSFTNNSATINGGAVFADKSRIRFINSPAEFRNNSAASGGAIYASNQTSAAFINSHVNFIANTALSSGGAVFISNSRMEIQSAVFRQNTADGKPNDIHFAGNAELVFSPDKDQSAVLESGITSEGLGNIIRKRGAGELLFTMHRDVNQTNFGLSRIGGAADMFIDFNGSFYIEEGKAGLNISSGNINSLTVANGAALEIIVNWAAPDLSFLYIDQLSVLPNALLSIISLGPTVNIGSSRTFMSIGNTDRPAAFGSVYDSQYIYSLDWNQDENGLWRASAIVRAFRDHYVGLNGALYANLRTLAAKTDFDFDFLGRQTDKKISFWTAGSFVGGAIIRERSEEDEFEIGDFGYDGTGVRIGWDFLSQGGIFFGYKRLDIHQGYDFWASGSDIEAGLYKIFDFRFAKLSFMTSYALQHFKANGLTKVNGQAIRALGEAELALFGSGGLMRGTSYQVSFFAQGRGAELKSEKILIKESVDSYEIEAKDWFRLELLGGFKLEYRIEALEFTGKVYSGGATMGNRQRFRWEHREIYGEIEGSDEGDFFVGGAIKAAYDLGKGVSLFMDGRLEKSVDAHNYGGDIGVRYKFSGFRGSGRSSQVKIFGSSGNLDDNDGDLIDRGGGIDQAKYAERNDKDTAALIADALKDRQQSSSNPSVAMVTLVYVSSGNPVVVEKSQRGQVNEREPLEFELKRSSAKEAQAIRNKAKKVFRLGNRSFGEDSTELTVKAKEEVRQLARQIKDLGFYRILVEGHTDDLTAGGNSLSSLRAQSVLIELRANGIPGNRVSFIDMGSSKPIVSNKTSAGRANNRRVDIIVE